MKDRALPQKREVNAKADDRDRAAQGNNINPRTLIGIPTPDIEHLRVVLPLGLVS